MKAFLERHAVSTYFVLTFVISWGGMLAIIGGPAHLLATAEEFDRLLPLTALTLTAGPTIAGLLMTGLVAGGAGYRDMLRRLLLWRVPARWYAVALLTAPVLAAVTLVPFALRSPAFLPPILTQPAVGSTVAITVFAALFGGLFEEIGWTGFAVPRLRQRHGVFSTGLIVGVVWAAWHFLVNLWGSPALSGGLPLALFAAAYLLVAVAHLTGYRILMVWVYDRTGSLLIAVLMHAALIASTVRTVLTPPTAGVAFLAWFFVLTALFWLAVAVVAVDGRRRGQGVR